MDASAAQKVQALQARNSKLHAELQVSERTALELESKVEDLKAEQQSYSETLLCVNRFWDQLNEDVELLFQRQNGFLAADADHQSVERAADPFLRQLVSANASAAEELRKHEDELLADASEVEKALSKRSAKLQQALARLLELISKDKARSLQAADNGSNEDGAHTLLKQHQALQRELDAQVALNRTLRSQISQVDERLVLRDKTITDLENELADKAHLLTAAQRKLIESRSSGPAQTSGSLQQGLTKQDSLAGSLHGNGPAPSAEPDGLQQLVSKRTAELDKEREANLLLQREVKDLKSRDAHPRQHEAGAKQLQLLSDEVEKQRFAVNSLHQQLDSARHRDQARQSQVEAGELARRQLAAAESRAAELERHLAASRDAMRDAELKLQQERAKHGPAESVAELMAMITTLRQEVALKQTRLEQANAGLERLQAARKEAQQAARDLQARDIRVHSLQQEAAVRAQEVTALSQQVSELKARLEDMRVFVEVLETYCDDPREVVEVRAAEARLKQQVQTLTSNGNVAPTPRHTILPEELESLRAREAVLGSEVQQLREASGKLQVEVGSLQRQLQQVQEDCATAKAEGETYLGEVGAISEAYEAVQEQNTRLLQQLTERDAANASLVSERIREGHSAAHMMEARDVAVAAAKRSGAECTALQGRVSGLESRLQASLDDAAAVQARLREAEHALEGTRGELRRREEAERTREERLAESERRQDDLRRRGEDDATREAKERAKRMRAEDDAKEMSNKLQKLQRDAAAASNKQLEAELHATRSLLRCKVCFERQKDTIITKCWHTFCNVCIKKNLETRHRKCPGCGVPFGQGDVKPVFLT